MRFHKIAQLGRLAAMGKMAQDAAPQGGGIPNLAGVPPPAELNKPLYGPKGSGLAPFSAGIPSKPRDWKHPGVPTVRTNEAYQRWMAEMHNYRELTDPHGVVQNNPWADATPEEVQGRLNYMRQRVPAPSGYGTVLNPQYQKNKRSMQLLRQTNYPKLWDYRNYQR